MPKQSAVALHLLSGVLANILVIGLIVWLHLVGAVPTILRNNVGMPLIIPQVGILILAQLMCIASSVAEPFVYAGSRQIKAYREGTTRPPISTRSLGIVRISYHVARHQRLNDRGSHRKAWAALQRELARGDLTPEEEMYALDWLITDGLTPTLTFADPLFRRKLDEWSERALRLGPKVKTLIGSRGSVLVELGRYQEGKALLQAVVFAKGGPLLDSLLTRMFLARAEFALGNRAAANRLITEARAIARGGVRGPALTAWIRWIQRQEVRYRRPHARRGFGRRSLKAHSKLSLPRLRFLAMDQAARSAHSRWSRATVMFSAAMVGLVIGFFLILGLVPEPNQSTVATRAAAPLDNNPPPDPQLNEQVVKVPVTVTLQDGTLHKGEFVLTTFKPNGPGPFPAVVVSHGRGSQKERAEFGRAEYGRGWMYYYWTLRGFVVLAPTRIGYGVSGADIDPERAPGSCDAFDFTPLASAVTAHIRATIEYAATQAWIDKDNLLLAGQSAGGFGSIVAAGERLPGVKALVNFAGGVGSSPQSHPEQPCSPQDVELQLVKAARRGAIPSIWLYAENDRSWGAKLPRAWHAAYVEAGGTAEFHMLPPLKEDGHEIIGSGYEHWRPRLDHFLTSMGFAPRKLAGAPRPTGFAPLGQAPPVPALFARCLERYDAFLKWDVPRAFALSPTGDCAYAAGELDVMAKSLKRCEERAKQACKLYAVNDEVVWVP
jgi:dienelactone hydrolase